MRLIVLGCSGSGPGPSSPASGYLLLAGDTRLTLDLGNGAFGALQRHLDPWSLSAVAFSHLHADHSSDFTSLAVYRRYHPRPPYDPTARKLPVLAPVDAPSRFAAAYATSGSELVETDLTDVFTYRPIVDGSQVEVGDAGDVTMRAGAVDHVCEAYALRVEHGGRSLVYSGDTGPSPGLVATARGADVLLCEATWPHVTDRWDEPPPGIHLSGRQAGEHAAAAGVGRLLITHVPVWYDAQELLAEAEEAFGGPVELVEPDGEYAI